MFKNPSALVGKEIWYTSKKNWVWMLIMGTLETTYWHISSLFTTCLPHAHTVTRHIRAAGVQIRDTIVSALIKFAL